jgi:hypothetical protein
MPQAMQGIALLRDLSLLKVSLKHHPGGRIAQGTSSLAIKEQRLSLLSLPHPFLQSLTGIPTQVNHSSGPILFPHDQMNLPLGQMHIPNPQLQQLSDPDPGPQ